MGGVGEMVKNATDVRRAAYFSRKLVLAEKYRMNRGRFQGARAAKLKAP